MSTARSAGGRSRGAAGSQARGILAGPQRKPEPRLARAAPPGGRRGRAQCAAGRTRAAARGGASRGRTVRAGAGRETETGMSGFLLALQAGSRAEPPRARVQEQDLRQWGLTGEWRSSARAGQLVRARLSGPGARRRGRAGLGAVSLRTAGPARPAPARGLGGGEPPLGPGSVPTPARVAGRAASRGIGSSGSPGAKRETFL